MIACSSCGQPAEWVCTHLVEKYIRIFVLDLKVGDRVCRNDETSPKPNSTAEIVSVEHKDGERHYRVTIAISRKHSAMPLRFKTFDSLPLATMRAAAEVSCAQPLCDNCAQDPADDHRRYCPDHWVIRMLESAAA